MNYSYLNDTINEKFITLTTNFALSGPPTPFSRELEIRQEQPSFCPTINFSNNQNQNQISGFSSGSISGVNFNDISSPNSLIINNNPMYDPMGMDMQQQQPKIPVPVLEWTTKASDKRTINDDSYYFQVPSKKYHELVETYGKPKAINYNRGGIAVWEE